MRSTQVYNQRLSRDTAFTVWNISGVLDIDCSDYCKNKSTVVSSPCVQKCAEGRTLSPDAKVLGPKGITTLFALSQRALFVLRWRVHVWIYWNNKGALLL